MKQDDGWMLLDTFWQDKRSRETYLSTRKTHSFFAGVLLLGSSLRWRGTARCTGCKGKNKEEDERGSPLLMLEDPCF